MRKGLLEALWKDIVLEVSLDFPGCGHEDLLSAARARFKRRLRLLRPPGVESGFSRPLRGPCFGSAPSGVDTSMSPLTLSKSGPDN